MAKRGGHKPTEKEFILTGPEVRFLVSNYYTSQEMRKRADMQIRHLGKENIEDVPALLQHTAKEFTRIEEFVKRELRKYAESTLVGRWCLSHYGIGPVITAGLLGNLD